MTNFTLTLHQRPVSQAGSASALPGRHWQAHTRAPGHQDQAPPQHRKHMLRLSSRLPSSRSESPPAFGRGLGVPGWSESGRCRRGYPASEEELALLVDSPLSIMDFTH